MLRRDGWVCLDGEWRFALDRDAGVSSPDGVTFDATIRVPFAPETPASGVNADGFIRRCWYRRTFAAPPLPDGGRLLLHFGAVDYRARVWVNNRLAVEHEGGYLPFHADVTDLLDGGENEITVQADDDPHDLAKPRGKQDWHEAAHSIWYPRTTGIWQTVWLEPVPATRVAGLRWTPDVARGEVRLEATVAGDDPAGCRLAVRLSHNGRMLCADESSVAAGGTVRRVFPVQPSGAIDDVLAALAWSPEHPNLIDANVRLLRDGGEVDRVESYTALRSVAIDGDRFLLNRRPRTLRLVLAQGYWPDGGLTPPDDDALRRDVELVKALGFDGVRMHQKIECPRFLHHADKARTARLGRDAQPVRLLADERPADGRAMGGGRRTGCEPPVRRRLGAGQRELGRAGPADAGRSSGRSCGRCTS